MKIQKYLVISASGSCKITVQRPALKMNEIAVLLQIQIPDSVFRRPSITATLTINEQQVVPEEITVEMKNNLQEVVMQNMGIELKIVDPEI